MPQGFRKNGTKLGFQKGNKYCLGRTLSEKGKKKISNANKGKIPWMKGRKHSIETLEKMRKIKIGKRYSEETKRKLSEIRRGKRMGKDNPNWQGGKTKLHEKIRNNFKYRQWRSDIFTRDNFTCQYCGNKKGGNLEAHHIKQMAKIIKENKITNIEQALNCEELWNVNNGQTLCKECHKKTDSYFIKIII